MIDRSPSPRAEALHERLESFVQTDVRPVEQEAREALDTEVRRGGLGVFDDTPIPPLSHEKRPLHLTDGADEVHERAIARRALRRRPMQSGASRREGR